VALAGLDSNIINTNYHIFDPGWYRLPGVQHIYHDWKKNGHGVMNVQRAIAVSCDTYFYNLGHKMGIAMLIDKLSQFGFGQLTNIDLYEEVPGILPNAVWKRKMKGAAWYPGDTLITAIGQGFMLASPLQIATAVAILSQKGIRHRPHLLRQSIKPNYLKMPNLIQNTVLSTNIRVPDSSITLNNFANWDIIIAAMRAVITSNEGTGYRFGRDAPYSVAAKTGTAEVFSSRQYENKSYTEIPEALRNHSLFIAFAPVEAPTIAIAVVVEHDASASYVARKVLDTYFAHSTQ
jgi:penicillin-binding protein 2